MKTSFSHLALLLAALVLAPAPAPALAKEPAPVVKIQPAEPNETDLQEHSHYTNKSGASIHSPAHSKSGAAPAGASAHCRDGTYSFSRSHRGTCSHHGGVASWL